MLLVTFTLLTLATDVCVSVRETDVAPGTKPLPVSVTVNVEPAAPKVGDMDVTVGLDWARAALAVIRRTESSLRPAMPHPGLTCQNGFSLSSRSE
ncbi:MAG: hypothetical protein DME87_12395 [Verrucomicrobia bacterium]|nr:MAG: hypothetical protein DME87_12395 [Verrucomicrobiota bacterium]